MNIDYYKALGVDEKASKEEIKAAYRTLSKKYHPDVNSTSNAAFLFQLIKEAYDNLYDDEKRLHYDTQGRAANCYYSDEAAEYEHDSTNIKAKINATAKLIVKRLSINLLKLIFLPLLLTLMLIDIFFLITHKITEYVGGALILLSFIFFVSLLYRGDYKEVWIALLIGIIGISIPKVVEFLSDMISNAKDKLFSSIYYL